MSTTTAKPNPNPDPTIAPDNGTADVRELHGARTGRLRGRLRLPGPCTATAARARASRRLLDGDYLDSDATLEFKTFGIPRTNLGTRIYTDGTPYKTTDAAACAGETTLDAETIMSLAPSSNYYLYLEPFFDDEGLSASYEKIVSDDLVGAVSSSFGACETDDPAFGYQTDYIAMEGSAEGITFSASTGDTGGGGCGGVRHERRAADDQGRRDPGGRTTT